jgi:zinc protease
MMKNLKRITPPQITSFNFGPITEVVKVELDNNVPIYIIEAGTEEIVRIEFWFPAGQIMESIPLVASITNAMLLEGSLNYSAESINRLIDQYGAFPNLSFDKDSAGFVIFTLNRYVEKILELCHEILFNPGFPDEELDTMMKYRLQKYQVNRQRVSVLSADYFFQSIFGKDHPYGRYTLEDHFTAINRSMLIDFHAQHYNISSMNIIISGKIPPQIVTILNRFFGTIKNDKRPAPQQQSEIKGEKTKKLFIKKADSVQTAIKIGSQTINKNHPDYPGLKVVDTILGGYFGSRLMKNIREDKGYTYGINSSVNSFLQTGYKIISTEVGSEYAEKTKEEIYKEIRLLQNEPVPGDELEVAKCYMSGEMLRMFDGPFALAESFRSVFDFGLDNSYYYRLAEKIKTIEPDEIMTLASTYYNIEDLYEVEAGRDENILLD